MRTISKLDESFHSSFKLCVAYVSIHGKIERVVLYNFNSFIMQEKAPTVGYPWFWPWFEQSGALRLNTSYRRQEFEQRLPGREVVACGLLLALAYREQVECLEGCLRVRKAGT